MRLTTCCYCHQAITEHPTAFAIGHDVTWRHLHDASIACRLAHVDQDAGVLVQGCTLTPRLLCRPRPRIIAEVNWRHCQVFASRDHSVMQGPPTLEVVR